VGIWPALFLLILSVCWGRTSRYYSGFMKGFCRGMSMGHGIGGVVLLIAAIVMAS
jgi:hypothetical protein